MRGAVPCLSADLTTHAVKTFHPAGLQNGEACAPRRAKRCGDERCKRRRCARILGLTLSWLGRRDDSNVRTCALFSVGLTTCVSTAISTLERVLRHQGRSASSQRQRKSSRWQQRVHVCAVLRRFDRTRLNGYQHARATVTTATQIAAMATTSARVRCSP